MEWIINKQVSVQADTAEEAISKYASGEILTMTVIKKIDPAMVNVLPDPTQKKTGP